MCVKFPLFKRGTQIVLPCLEGGGGGAKSFRPAIFPFVGPLLPVINDQSLRGAEQGSNYIYHLGKQPGHILNNERSAHFQDDL